MEHGGKGILGAVLGPRYSGIVFVLLYEVIVIHMQLTFVENWGPRFENLLWGVFGGFPILSMSSGRFYFQNHNEDLLKVIFDIFRNLESSRTRSKVWRTYWFVGNSWESRKLLVTTPKTWSGGARHGHEGLVFIRAPTSFWWKYDDR